MTTTTLPRKEILPALLRTTEIVKYLNISRQTVRNLIDNGHLKACNLNPATKERRHLRVTRDSLCAYYKKQFGHSLLDAIAHKFQS